MQPANPSSGRADAPAGERRIPASPRDGERIALAGGYALDHRKSFSAPLWHLLDADGYFVTALHLNEEQARAFAATLAPVPAVAGVVENRCPDCDGPLDANGECPGWSERTEAEVRSEATGDAEYYKPLSPVSLAVAPTPRAAPEGGAERVALDKARNALVALRPVIDAADIKLPGIAGRCAAYHDAVAALASIGSAAVPAIAHPAPAQGAVDLAGVEDLSVLVNRVQNASHRVGLFSHKLGKLTELFEAQAALNAARSTLDAAIASRTTGAESGVSAELRTAAECAPPGPYWIDGTRADIWTGENMSRVMLARCSTGDHWQRVAKFLTLAANDAFARISAEDRDRPACGPTGREG